MLTRMRSILILLFLCVEIAAAQKGFLQGEFLFPKETWHNHASCIVEAPNGDLIVCWFHGSGERTADDVKILGARKRKGETVWSEPFVMADTPDYPDTNCAMFIDPQARLWLLWPTILANRWESALMKYRISTNYLSDGPPVWNVNEVMHVTPGPEFVETVNAWLTKEEPRADALPTPETKERARTYFSEVRRQANDKLSRRLGWMTRAHPFVLEGQRLIVPLYSDGFSFSLMAITDNWGATWKTSTPLCGLGNIQPSIVQRKDGSLFTLMRDNGLAPKRLHQSTSRDRGETWSEVTDSALPNPGAGAEIIGLKNGNWLLISNDTERGRGSLAVQISDDEGVTWKWKRHLEKDEQNSAREEYHYPSVIQARDGTLHASYSHHLKPLASDAGAKPAKTIKHSHFNEEWIRGE
jgi:predicted neuraminidase